mgnify:CR=1 FL=1
MKPLYTLKQFETQGWVTIATNLIKEDAKDKLDALIANGLNPQDLKPVSYTHLTLPTNREV